MLDTNMNDLRFYLFGSQMYSEYLSNSSLSYYWSLRDSVCTLAWPSTGGTNVKAHFLQKHLPISWCKCATISQCFTAQVTLLQFTSLKHTKNNSLSPLEACGLMSIWPCPMQTFRSHKFLLVQHLLNTDFAFCECTIYVKTTICSCSKYVYTHSEQ